MVFCLNTGTQPTSPGWGAQLQHVEHRGGRRLRKAGDALWGAATSAGARGGGGGAGTVLEVMAELLGRVDGASKATADPCTCTARRGRPPADRPPPGSTQW